jgi:DNA-binding NarL/FixJ family response regulator
MGMGSKVQPEHDQQTEPAAQPAQTAPGLIRVLIVDDHRVFAEALQVVLTMEPDIEVAGFAATAREALERVEAEQPDVVLLDHYLPDGHGTDIVAPLKARSPRTNVVMLTTEADEEIVARAIQAGACGYLTKVRAVDDVVQAVRRAAQGDILVPPDVLEYLLRRLQSPQQERQRPAPESVPLTGREREILAALAKGWKDDEIAAHLAISLFTVRTHIRNILHKLKVHSRLEAVLYCLRSGAISLD